MAWEQRAGRLYYYQKRRQGNRVISEYVGSGHLARLAGALDKHDQERRRRDREERSGQQADLHLAELHIRRLSSSVLSVVQITLMVSGFHYHKGQWRKVRNG